MGYEDLLRRNFLINVFVIATMHRLGYTIEDNNCNKQRQIEEKNCDDIK